MKTFDDEAFLLEIYRGIPFFRTIYNGNFFSCLRIEVLTKCFLFNKSWEDSSSKNAIPPDFYNERHKIMMEIMRIDDCIGKVNGKKIENSFSRSNNLAKRILGDNYKKNINGILFTNPDTTNSTNFNFRGYIKNFNKVFLKHSNKIEMYRKNHPNCKDVIFFILDQSNNYVQVSRKEDLKKENQKNPYLENCVIHNCFMDDIFLKTIEESKVDYVIWVKYHSIIFVNGKKKKLPEVCIFDVKHMKEKFKHRFNHELMLKLN